MDTQNSKVPLFFSSNRLEALTDGVFAIAMTLLVLGLELPPIPAGESGPALAEAILDLRLPLAKYAISFILLGAFWVLHIRQIHHIRRVDLTGLWLGMGSLLLITLVPFSTSLVSDFPGKDAAELFFHLNILGISVLFALQWIHATRGRRLVSPELPEEIIEMDRRLNLIIPAIALIGLVTAPFGSFESNLLYVIVPFLFPLLRRFA
ncbi:MAG: TMEM175 family protein [Synergistales bacterium]